MLGLENLSVNYNKLNNVNEFAKVISEKCPLIKTINTLKNPMNPGFGNNGYIQYKATLKQIKTLELIDGFDVNSDVNIKEYNESISSQKKNLFNNQMNDNNNNISNNNISNNNMNKQNFFDNKNNQQPKKDLFGNSQPKKDLFGNRTSTQPKKDLFGNNTNTNHQKVNMFDNTNTNNNNIQNQPSEKVNMFDNPPKQKVSMFDNPPKQKVSMFDNPPKQKVSMFDNPPKQKVSMFDNMAGQSNENKNQSNNNGYKKPIYVIDESGEIDGNVFVKSLKKKSSIVVNMKILQKSDNMTKFNRKNKSEGNKHILNEHL